MATTKKQAITLKGSTKTVTEFFEYSVNTILYQRAIYPPEDFKLVKKYGLTLLTTVDDNLERYLKTIVDQIRSWMMSGNVTRLVMAIISKETRETVERWQFDVHLEDRGSKAAKSGTNGGKENSAPTGAVTTEEEKASEKKSGKEKEKTPAEVQKAVQDIMRQITATVTFLPAIEEKCVFNILVYTDKDTAVPSTWQDSDPHNIAGNAEQVKLRSFSTNVHRVESMVAYRLNEER